MLVKTGEGAAVVKGMRAPLIRVLPIISSVFEIHNYYCMLTEGTGGKHMKGSLHYKGLAGDFRTRHIVNENEIDDIVEMLKEALGNDYDVIKEKTHIHIEYDPK
jgi:hypothetical protein